MIYQEGNSCANPIL